MEVSADRGVGGRGGRAARSWTPPRTRWAPTSTASWVENAPLRRASFFDLVAAAPGSLQAGDASTRARWSTARPTTRTRSRWTASTSRTTTSTRRSAEPNVDAIDEVEVLSLGAPAEYGNLTGAVYNIVTRQGTNEFHGDLNFFWQIDGLTSNNTDGIVNPDGTFFNACADGSGPLPLDARPVHRLHGAARRARSSRTSSGSSRPTRTSGTTTGTSGVAELGDARLSVASTAPTATSASSTGSSAPSHKLVGTFHLDDSSRTTTVLRL